MFKLQRTMFLPQRLPHQEVSPNTCWYIHTQSWSHYCVTSVSLCTHTLCCQISFKKQQSLFSFKLMFLIINNDQQLLCRIVLWLFKLCNQTCRQQEQPAVETESEVRQFCSLPVFVLLVSLSLWKWKIENELLLLRYRCVSATLLDWETVWMNYLFF